MAEQPEIDIAIDYTVNIVSHYVRANPVPAAQLPALIADIHAALVRLASGVPADAPSEAVTPAEIRKSIRPDALISFIDGQPYQTLKRHLAAHGLTPDSYRARFGLPADYPTTSPAYSAKRSMLAKSLGLGTTGRAVSTQH